MKKIASILLCFIIMAFTIIPAFAQTYQLNNNATPKYDFSVEIPDSYTQKDFNANNTTMAKLRAATTNNVQNREYYVFQNNSSSNAMFLIATGTEAKNFEVVGTKSVSKDIVDSVLNSITLVKPKEPETEPETTTTTTKAVAVEDLEDPVVIVNDPIDEEPEIADTTTPTTENETTTTVETTTEKANNEEKSESLGLFAKLKSLFNKLKSKKIDEPNAEYEENKYMLTVEGVTKSKELTITLVNSAGTETKIKLNEQPEKEAGKSSNIIMGNVVLQPGTYKITKIKSSWDIKITLVSDDTLIVSEANDVGVITVQEKEMNFFLKLLRKNIILIVLLIGLLIAYFKIQYNKTHIYEKD